LKLRASDYFIPATSGAMEEKASYLSK